MFNFCLLHRFGILTLERSSNRSLPYRFKCRYCGNESMENIVCECVWARARALEVRRGLFEREY